MSPQEVKEESKLSRRMSDRQHDTALFRCARLHAGYSATTTDIVPFHCGLGLVRKLPKLPWKELTALLIRRASQGWKAGPIPQ